MQIDSTLAAGPTSSVAFPKELLHAHVVNQQDAKKANVWQGTLAIMVLRTLEVMGPLHGYGIARRIEQTSENLLSINQGTLYPVLLRLEQEGAVRSEWGNSDNNRKAKFYHITKAGRRQLASEMQQWEQTMAIVGRFSALKGGA